MGKDFKFKVHEDSERANDFMKVFGRLEECGTSFISELANLPRFDEPQYVFMIDLSELSYDERIRLADHLSERFGVALSEIDAQIAKRGVPILASEGVITVENPHRWIDLDYDDEVDDDMDEEDDDHYSENYYGGDYDDGWED